MNTNEGEIGLVVNLWPFNGRKATSVGAASTTNFNSIHINPCAFVAKLRRKNDSRKT